MGVWVLLLSIWLIRYLLGKLGNMHPFIQSVLFSEPDYAFTLSEYIQGRATLNASIGFGMLSSRPDDDGRAAFETRL